MIEDIFLAYANNLLKNNPQNFHTILEQVEKNENIISIDKAEFDPIIEYIIKLSKYTDYQEFLSNIKNYGSVNHYDGKFNEYLYQAVLAIAGERESFYEYVNIWKERDSFKKDFKFLVEHEKQTTFQCDLRKIVNNYIGKDCCEEQFVQKCYECHQLSFRYCLSQIVQNKEFLEIDNFKDIMICSEDIGASKTCLIIEEENNKPFCHALKSVKTIFPVFYEYCNNLLLGNSYHTFNKFIFSLASYSLTEFLVVNDRRKLKFCPYCERFFIAKDIKRKHSCYSNDCIRKWERDKKKDQRDKDPVKYI